MPRVRALLAAALGTALLVGCATQDETPYATKSTTTETATGTRTTTTVIAPEHIRRHHVVLAEGDSLSIRTKTDGSTRIEVVIAEGRANAGTYDSHAAGLLETARNAKDALTRGGRVGVHIDDKDEIVGIWWE